MANFCSSCGSKISPNAKFCPVCGAKIAQASQAGGAQPGQPVRPQGAPRKSGSGGSGALCFLLAAVLVIELAVVGFYRPGLFIRDGKPLSVGNVAQGILSGGTDGNSGAGSSGHSQEGQADQAGISAAGSGYDEDELEELMWAENAVSLEDNLAALEDYDMPWEVEEILDMYRNPVPVSSFDVAYTSEEIASAPKVEAAVSPANPTVSLGQYTADFGEWGLVGEDTLIVRDLPVHTDEDAGVDVKGYDFSLASGQHKFPTEVVVTIPRTAEGDDGYVVTRGDDGELKRVYSEISEDGKSYKVYISHFTEIDEVRTSSELYQRIKKYLVETSSVDKMTAEYMSAFYYPTYVSWTQRMSAPVDCYFPYLWHVVEPKFITNGDSILQQMAETVKNTPKDQLAYKVPIYGYGEYVNKTNDFVGGVNDAKDVTDALELTHVVTKQNENFFRAFGALTMLVGAFFTIDRTAYELGQGKSYANAVGNNWLGWLGIGVGFIGTIFTAPAVGTTCAIAGLSMLAYSLYDEYIAYKPDREVSPVEQVYRSYYKEGGVSRRIYYDMPEYAGRYKDGVGSMKPVSLFNDKQNAALKQFINEGLAQALYPGGLPGEDPQEIGTVSGEWAWVYRLLIEMCASDMPDKTGDVLLEFCRNYAEAAWNMDGSSYLEFAKDTARKWGWDADVAVWPEDSLKKDFTKFMVSELLKQQEIVLTKLVLAFDHEAHAETETRIKEELIPLLNTEITFRVVDDGLDNPWSFEDSIYSRSLKYDYSGGNQDVYGFTDLSSSAVEAPMSFMVKKGGGYEPIPRYPMFYPQMNVAREGVFTTHTKTTDYYPCRPTSFPLPNGVDNEVFVCTLYHYLMMGSPTAVRFHDLDHKIPDQTVDFTLPEPGADGMMYVELHVNGKTEEKKEEVHTESGSYKILPVEDESRHSFGAPNNYMYAIDKAFENATLQLNSDGTFSGSGSWSQGYQMEEVEPETDPYYSFSQSAQESISASIRFSGRVGTDDEDGTWEFSGTVNQGGSSNEEEVNRGKIKNNRLTVTINDNWDYSFDFSGEGSVSWFNDSREPGGTKERCLMLFAGYDCRRSGNYSHKADHVYSGEFDDKPADEHVSTSEPMDKDIEGLDAMYIFFP